jgi:sulfite reductase (ferredoxin)
MNFVKTKLALAKMESGQKLEIWIDDGEPIENVPGSILQDGHEILEKRQAEAGYWLILMRKK